MDAYPFCIFKRADRPCFLVKFKDDAGKYLPPVSTKKNTRDEAMQVAFKWLKDGIPQKNSVVRVNDLSVKDMARKLKQGDDVDTLLTELNRLGWVKSFVRKDTPQAEDFISFMTNFWNWETSPYIKEKLRKSHGIHKMHCLKQGQSVSKYWEPFFKGRYLGDITACDVDAFITHMGEMALSASRKNVVIKAGIKPLRWAFSKGKIEKDPTRGHMMFSGDETKRNILNPTAVAAAFRAVWKDNRAMLANMLASVTGMRSGEIMALRFQDIGADCLYVRGAWNRADKIKLPKNNKIRTVELPFPDLIYELVELAKQNPWGATPDSFVFWTETKPTIPMRGCLFVQGLREVLIQIGFTKDEAVKYDFHGWRHFFTSYMIKKLNKKLVKGETGHLTDAMIDLYSDHETEGDRELIQVTKKETFSGLLPERRKMLMFNNEAITEAACG